MTEGEYTDWFIEMNRIESTREDIIDRCLEWLIDKGKVTGYIEIEWGFQPDAIIAIFKHERALGVRIPIGEVTE